MSVPLAQCHNALRVIFFALFSLAASSNLASAVESSHGGLLRSEGRTTVKTHRDASSRSAASAGMNVSISGASNRSLPGADGDESQPWVIPASEMDVVMPLHKPTCIIKDVIRNLNMFFGPRRILIATRSDHCPDVEHLAHNVICIDESKVVPGLSLEAIKNMKVMQQNGSNSWRGGFGDHTIAGWYLQQFIKLGIAESSSLPGEGLSQTYLVWDSDMVLVNKFEPFDKQGRIPLMAGGDAVCVASRHVCDYWTTYKALVNEPCSDSPFSQGSVRNGYVSHHMVMYKPFVLEMLEAFKGSDRSWFHRVVSSACDRGLRECECGFSEYHSMASWLKARHAHAIVDVPAAFDREVTKCCPSEGYLKLSGNAGRLFVGFEQGACKVSEEARASGDLHLNMKVYAHGIYG